MLAEEAARPEEQDGREQHADQHDLQRGGARLVFGREDGRRCSALEALHRPQTTTAPRMAPRLLPAPPTISIAQTWKVSAER